MWVKKILTVQFWRENMKHVMLVNESLDVSSMNAGGIFEKLYVLQKWGYKLKQDV